MMSTIKLGLEKNFIWRNINDAKISNNKYNRGTLDMSKINKMAIVDINSLDIHTFVLGFFSTEFFIWSSYLSRRRTLSRFLIAINRVYRYRRMIRNRDHFLPLLRKRDTLVARRKGKKKKRDARIESSMIIITRPLCFCESSPRDISPYRESAISFSSSLPFSSLSSLTTG